MFRVMYREKIPTITNISFGHHGNEKAAEKLIKLVDTILEHRTDSGTVRLKLHQNVFL